MIVCKLYSEEGESAKIISVTTAEKILGKKIEYSGNYTTCDGEVVVVEGLPKKPKPEPVHVRTWADDKDNLAKFDLPDKTGYEKKYYVSVYDDETGKSWETETTDVPNDARYIGENIYRDTHYGEDCRIVEYEKVFYYTYRIKYKKFVPEATGACQKCKRTQCLRRGQGIKCRNFREIRE